MARRTLPILALALMLAGGAGLVSLALLNAWLSSSPQGQRDAQEQASPSDRMFIEQMVPHHQDAIDMAEIALERAEHPEVRQLAATIAQTQSAENELMRRWYREWFGDEVPDAEDGSPMRGPMMGRGTDLDRLRNAEEFDREFIEQMVPHHRMAVMMARMAGRSSGRRELRQLTSSIVDSQSAEIEDMQRWYNEWYGN